MTSRLPDDDVTEADPHFATSTDSPWREVFDSLRQLAAGKRDADGAIGSINWLRFAMERHGANPNVVRNIIYRDKGRLPDKRALYRVLTDLSIQLTGQPMDVPGLAWLASPYAAAEQEVMQVLGREQRRAYRMLIGGVRERIGPKVLITGKPGSGKTILTDYVQEGLALEGSADLVVARSEFVAPDLADALARLAAAVGVDPDLVESRLMRVAIGSAFAVQADAQAEIARLILDAARHRATGQLVLLIRLSRGLGQAGTMAGVPLRLNNPDVERVSALDWLWLTLLRPLSTLPDLSLFVSVSELPRSAHTAPGAFGQPIRLSPPTATESRRFVKARLPEATDAAVEKIVAVAARSYEELRTLALLAQARAGSVDAGGLEERSLEQLSQLAGPAGETELRTFLAAFAVLAAPDFDGYQEEALLDLLGRRRRRLSDFELSFLDPVPRTPGHYRPFSRELARLISERLEQEEPERHRDLQLRAAAWYRKRFEETACAAGSEGTHAVDESVGFAARYVHHALAAADWHGVADWLEEIGLPYQLLQRVWHRAREAGVESELLERIAQQVAAHFVRLGAYQHAEAVRAFELLSASLRPALRAWAFGKRAEGEVAQGRFERALALLDSAPATDDRAVRAVHALARASVERWRGELGAAALSLAEATRGFRPGHEPRNRSERDLLAKVKLAEARLQKDRGELKEAFATLSDASLARDDLTSSRLAFQRGDVAARLGLLDTALKEFDLSVDLSSGSDALEQEQGRFLARRGSLHRLRGDVAAARRDFAAAKERIASAQASPSEAAFWNARVADEEAYTLLAEARFEEVALSLTAALAAFRAYEQRHGVDASFRILRSSLRLAVCYALQDLRQPFRRPFSAAAVVPAPAKTTRTQGGVEEVLQAVEERLSQVASAEANGHLLGLRHDALIFAALLGDPRGAAPSHVARAVATAWTPYEKAKAHSVAAALELRLGDADAAVGALEAAAGEIAASLLGAPPAAAEGERGDMGLLAQLAAHRSAAGLIARDMKSATEALCDALEAPDLARFHEDILRAFGASAEVLDPNAAWLKQRRVRTLLGVNGTGPSTPARLPDALVAAWRSRHAPVAV